MNKFVLTFIAVAALAFTAEAAPRRDRHPSRGRREPPRRVHHHPSYRPHRKAPSWGWGLNLSPGGLSVGVGTRVGRHGVVGVSLPLVRPEPVVRETVIVQQPVVQQPVVQQQVIVQQPAVQQQVVYSVTDTLTPSRVWVEGHWKTVRDGYGNIVSKTWVPGHWE